MECNVIRDLMPLVQDDVASEESKRIVQAHIAECPACAEYLKNMQVTLKAANGQREKEQRDFDKAAHQLRVKRRRRVGRNVLIGMMVGVLLVVGGMWGWTKLTQEFNTLVYYGEYGVFLTQLSDGRTSVNLDFRGSSSYTVADMEEQIEDGQTILYVNLKRPYIKRNMDQPMVNYSCCLLSANDLRSYAEIRQGASAEYCVVWQNGNIIPAASPEMETYFAIEDEIEAINLQVTPEGKAVALSRKDEQRLFELQMARQDALETVPEWQ